MGEEPSTDVEELVESLYRELCCRVLAEIRREPDETRRYLRFFAWLNTGIENAGAGRLIITGGFAVEVLTGRVYRTMDVDVVAEGRAAEVVEKLVSRFSERIGRGYLPAIEELAVKSIDVVSTVYRGSAEPIKLVVGEYYVYVEAPEELVVRYLSGWKWWDSTEDRDKALWVYMAWASRMDLELLERRAREEGVEDKLAELQEIVERYTRAPLKPSERDPGQLLG